MDAIRTFKRESENYPTFLIKCSDFYKIMPLSEIFLS